jgi:hypothetical protein
VVPVISTIKTLFAKYYPEAVRWVVTNGSAAIIAFGVETHWHF